MDVMDVMQETKLLEDQKSTVHVFKRKVIKSVKIVANNLNVRSFFGDRSAYVRLKNFK